MHRPGKGKNKMALNEKAKNPKRSLKRLWNYFTKRKLTLVMVFIFIAISSITNLIGPYLMGRAIDDYIIPADITGLAKISLLMAAVYLISAFFRWLQQYLMISVSQATIKELRSELFAKMHSLSLNFFDQHSRGELMSRLTNDIENINAVLTQSVIQFFDSIISLTAVIIIMFILNYQLTLITILAIPLLAFLTKYIARYTHLHFSKRQQNFGDLNAYIEEQISAQKIIKSYAQEKKTVEKFKDKNEDFRKSAIKARFFSSIMAPIMNLSNNFSFALIAGVGGFFAINQIATVGTVATFLNYVRDFNRPIQSLAEQYNGIQSALAGAERIFSILDEESELKEKDNPLKISKLKGKVEFENVYFSYTAEEDVLKNISFKADPGEMIALVGPTGAGKTTIINLLTRFYDIDQGQILIDDINIEDYKIKELRSRIGVVLQDSYLFADTIRENIRFGNLNADDQEVEKAAELANAAGFINKLPKKYESEIKAEGSNLSQGQRQLISIARTILADPDILILDEATSSIDTKTEKDIQQAMENLMSQHSSFVIAHRLSTIENADRILLIDDGKIIEKGNHQELIEAKSFYYELYNSQFKDFDAV